jgi:hypothetical protein
MWDKLDALINAPLNIGEAIKLLQRMEKPDEPETESAAPLDE